MRRFLAGRLAQAALTVLIATVIAFLLVRLAPGEPFAYEDPSITPGMRAQLRADFGYDKPVGVQLVHYVRNVLTGNLGQSTVHRRPVVDVIGTALPRTLTLAGISIVLAMILGTLAGVVAAARRRRAADHVISTISVFIYSIPDFWLALIIQLGIGFWLTDLPTGGLADPTIADYGSPMEKFVDRIRHLVLPVLTMTLLIAVIIARFQRAALIEVLPADFLRTARAKGLPERRVIARHALRNALTPTITVLGLLFPVVLGGVYFVEYIFSWPGMGQLSLKAVSELDYDVATGTVIVSGVLVAMGNLIADLLTALADPRVRDA